MALVRALGLSPSSSACSFFFPNIKLTANANVSSISSFSPLFLSLPYRSKRSFSLICSATENYVNHSVVYPRPPEIQWKKELANSVSLIGTVGVPVEIKHLPSGKAVAWTRLAVKKSSTETSCDWVMENVEGLGKKRKCWNSSLPRFLDLKGTGLQGSSQEEGRINLTFWDELAHVSFQHVEKGQQIHVSGRLVSDSVENDDGKQQTYYKVVVQQLNLVERSLAPVTSYNQDDSFMMAGRKFNAGSASANSMGSIEEQWQAFFANPVDWWDNRKNKKNSKYPDFKHKDTGEALWVDGRYNPTWVKSQLAILDTRMGFLNDQGSRRDKSLVTSDDFPSY